MKIKSLTLKNKLTDDNGDAYLDLSEPSMKEFIDTTKKAIYVVTKETEMRLDLISIKYYGSTSYIDVLCKANNIFNPFSIQEGDVLVIPTVQKDDSIYEKPKEAVKEDLREQFKDSNRLSEKDQERIQRLKELAKGKKGQVNDVLPTNMLQENEVTKVVNEDGTVKLRSNFDSQEGNTQRL